MLAVDAPRELLEQRHLYLLELGKVDDVQYLFHLAEEHHLFRRVHFRPVLEQAQHDVLGQGAVLLQKLDDAVGELWMIHRQTLDLVQGDEDAHEEGLVLLLERQSEAVDDGPQDL